MIVTHAAELAVKISQTWPRSSVATDVWEEELADLDRPRAEAALKQMRRTVEHAPSVAAFLSAYRAQSGTAGVYEWNCPKCANTGWVTDEQHPRHWTGRPEDMPKIPPHYGPADGCLCNVVTPCGCDHGKNAAKSDLRPQINRDPADVPSDVDRQAAFMAIAAIREGLEARKVSA
jgi:hypothetical protein